MDSLIIAHIRNNQLHAKDRCNMVRKNIQCVRSRVFNLSCNILPILIYRLRVAFAPSGKQRYFVLVGDEGIFGTWNDSMNFFAKKVFFLSLLNVQMHVVVVVDGNAGVVNQNDSLFMLF